MIRAIIIDDEPSAVEVIRMLLLKKCTGTVQVIATSNFPLEGRQLIEALKPDLVFLDIEMPGMSGLDLAAQVQDLGCRIIFITAYDAYAIEAFRVSAVDYLLKPVDSADLVKAVAKVAREIEQQDTVHLSQLRQLQKLLNASADPAPARIGIGMADKIQFIATTDILYCQANGAYTNIHMADGSKLVASKSLGDFQEQLSAGPFFRIHHSYLINLNLIKEFQRNDGGYVVMSNNARLEVSQRRRKEFLDAVQHLIV